VCGIARISWAEVSGLLHLPSFWLQSMGTGFLHLILTPTPFAKHLGSWSARDSGNLWTARGWGWVDPAKYQISQVQCDKNLYAFFTEKTVALTSKVIRVMRSSRGTRGKPYYADPKQICRIACGDHRMAP
jgi:hypothetical protein